MTKDGRLRRTGFAALAAVAGMALVAGCSSSGTTSGGGENAAESTTTTEPAPVPGGRMVFGVQGEVDGYLPQASRWSPSGTTVAKAIFDPVVVVGDDNRIHPYLLESINPSSPDFTAWELKAREGVTFHNGTPFDADAMLVNLESFKTSPLTANAFKPVTGISKVDQRTVRLTLDVAWANFPSLFLTQAGFFAAPEQVKAGDTAKPIGTGPFRYEAWSPGTPFKAKKNPDYWQEGLPYLDQIDFVAIPDNDSRRKAVDAGDIDVAHTNISGDITRMAKKGDLPRDAKIIVEASNRDIYHGVFNTQTGEFADKDLRLALIAATDQAALVNQLFEGFMDPAVGPFGPGSGWDVPTGYPSPDPEKAREVVDAWKAAHGGQAPSFSVTTLNNNEDTQIAQLLQQQWQSAGFDVTIEGFDEAKFTTKLITGDFDLLVYKFSNNADPDAQYPFWGNDAIGGPGQISLNFARYNSPTVAEHLLEGRTAIDPAARREAYAKVFQEWSDNGVYLWLFYAKWALFYNQRVHGLDKAVAPDGTPTPPLVNGAPILAWAWIEQ